MKKMHLFLLPLFSVFFLLSCSSVDVLADYDTEVDFKNYKTYAFYKTGIDKAQISDLDKKRILKAIEAEMAARGFVKDENPQILVSIFTKEQERVDVYNYGWGWGPGWGWGWGWGPYWGWGWGPGMWGPAVSTYTEGTLFIDLIDARKKVLVWQGKGVGSLSRSKKIEKKEKRIREFVSEIMQEYPPNPIASLE